MGRIVAISGGELNTTHRINKYIVEAAKKKNPHFLFICTAYFVIHRLFCKASAFFVKLS